MKIPTLTLKGQTTEWAMTKKWQRRAEGGGWIGEEEEDEEGPRRKRGEPWLVKAKIYANTIG